MHWWMLGFDCSLLLLLLDFESASIELMDFSKKWCRNESDVTKYLRVFRKMKSPDYWWHVLRQVFN